MYKLLRIYEIETEGNKVMSAKYDVVQELEVFNVDEETEKKLTEICKQKKVPHEDVYLVVKYVDEEPVSVEGNFFYHEDEGYEPFLDCAEWDFRVYASVALSKDLM